MIDFANFSVFRGQILLFVVVEAFAALPAEPAGIHVLLQKWARAVFRVAKAFM